MNNFFKSIFKGDSGLWVIILLFMAGSFLVVFSATSNAAFRLEASMGDFYNPIRKHTLHMGFALLVCILGSRVPPKVFARLSNVALIGVVLLLLYVLFFGVDLNDGKRWANILGVQFQPSEIARLALINFVAFRLGQKQYNSKREFVIIGISTLLVCGLIFWENASTGLLLGFVIFLMMVIGGAHTKYLLMTFLGGLLAAVIGVSILMALPNKMVEKMGRFGTVKGRIERFVKAKSLPHDPNKSKVEEYIEHLDIDGRDSQIAHSHIAMATGGVFGVGPGNSESRFVLPHPYSDFIYAIIVEEYGLVGSFAVLALYAILFFRIALFARKTTSIYLKLLSMGIGLAIFLQALINMLVATGVFPVTGQPLPFLSRGGTSYVVTAAYFAVLLAVSNLIKQDNERREAAVAQGQKAAVVDMASIPAIDQEIYGEGNDQ